MSTSFAELNRIKSLEQKVAWLEKQVAELLEARAVAAKPEPRTLSLKKSN